MLNAIIVDDEAPARSELRFLLDEVGGVEVTAEAANVREAIEKLKEYPCDVMFMNVNMPWIENPDWVGGEHGPDEGVSEELLKTSFKIYVLALAELQGLEIQ